MYNRYIPQPDGSYHRNSVSEPVPQPRQEPPPRKQPSEPKSPQIPSPPPPPKPIQQQSIGSFIKQLLPKGFDTADLMIVLLLILMAGDCEEDQNTALLTLVLYLFL